MHHFTPWTALAGGLLIGAAAVLLLFFNGRIAGISGIAGRIATAARGDRAWRWAFVAGLLAGAGVWAACGGATPVREGFPRGVLVAAGLLVGYGTALSNGCTSGHGVCGMARLSRRSIAATATFLAVAVATTFVARHLLGVPA
ncbi:YeeE/YedE family protein [Xylophilus sp.]|uniref:YeeE/YedE family protein n=1 Tax=Xylophilus sp. TaxID=2653893 RepID=UPI0013B5E557|nr:YeeE/YedE family protein [Xylophilus sp.]KAF1046281.1 MAG: hypothetical protein GAK38_02521 [Xylophilus sp.]